MEFGCSFYFGALVVFIVFATIKGWVRWKGGSPIALLTVFHDFQPKDKQEAIEISNPKSQISNQTKVKPRYHAISKIHY
ncbi:MAG: hypothetical protein QME25_09050 [Bacteroidota bacterium]|nr:hypothetical protein [Bacteroidota bacterium]